MIKKLIVILMGGIFLLGLAACDAQQADDAASRERRDAEQGLRNLVDGQPVPAFQRSQLRQNLIEIETAQAETTQTTSFFYNLGIDKPIMSCPSIGFPIPTTMQLTNPNQIVQADYGDGWESQVIAQAEPTGVYTGDSTGTYVICVDAQGNAFAVYWEGFVQSVTGPAEWVNGEVKLIGSPSFDFSEK